MNVAELDLLERLIAAQQANTGRLDDLRAAVEALTHTLLAIEVPADRRPIEERDRPMPTLHREDT